MSKHAYSLKASCDAAAAAAAFSKDPEAQLPLDFPQPHHGGCNGHSPCNGLGHSHGLGGFRAHPPPTSEPRGRPLILSPPETYAECARHGEEKARLGWLKLAMLTVIAGCYVGFGFSICLLIGGNIGMDILKERPGLFNLVFGAIGFPTGFTFIVICGGELFTSLCAYMAAAWWEGRATAGACIRLWVVSWVGNFVGTAIFVGLMVASGAFDGKDAYAMILATKKTHHGFGACFVLGVLCNWLVCIATWQANAAQDMTGKFIAIWLPISAFVMLGCEHIVADMYLLPLSIALGHPSLTAFDVAIGTLLPTTLGNWFGGAVCVATVYAFAYGTPNKTVTEWAARKARRDGADGGVSKGGAGFKADGFANPQLRV